MAVDINKIEGKSVLGMYKKGNLGLIKSLQDSFDSHKNISGNYGPAYIHKNKVVVENERLQKGHRNHVHVDAKP